MDLSRLETLGTALETACPAIAFAYLFGSAATGHMGPRSDVDIAIYLSGNDNRYDVGLDAAGVAASHLGTDAVDLVVLNTAPVSLAGRILGTRRVLIDREPFRRHQYESLTARMFHDFRLRERRLLAARFGHG